MHNGAAFITADVQLSLHQIVECMPITIRQAGAFIKYEQSDKSKLRVLSLFTCALQVGVPLCYEGVSLLLVKAVF